MEEPPTTETPAPSRWQRLRQSRPARWIIDLMILAAVFLGVTAWQSRHLLEDHAQAPPLDLPALKGGRLTGAELEGQKTVLVFWAPWCGVCGAESGTISRLQRAVGDDVDVVSVALGYDRQDEVERFVSEHEVDYPVLLGDAQTTEAWRVQAFPTIYILDERGRVASTLVGYTSGLGLRWRLWLA